MAMTKASLVARLKAQYGAPPTTEGAAIQDESFNKLAQAILDEIQINGALNVTSGIPVATTGTAAAQTGITTAPGTGTIL